MARVVIRSGRVRTLEAVRPNLGLEVEYRRRLRKLIEAMHRSAMRWVIAAYRADPPVGVVAEDESPVAALRTRMRQLGRQWERSFAEAAPRLGDWFARAVMDRSDRSLKRILRDAGISVRFQMPPGAQEVLDATIGEQVALIKSIGAQHHATIEGMVMRSMSTGGDLQQLSTSLQEAFGVSRRRAGFIARDQNRKATATITRVRQQEIGVKEAIWLHSAGGREPRPEHVAFSGKRYDVAKGMWSEVDRAWVWPGTAINCRCVTKAIIPGLE